MSSKYNKDTVILIATILRSKILFYKNIDTILSNIIDIQCKYLPSENDNINSVDYIFKLYLFYGKVSDMLKHTNKTYKEITDILVYGKSTDIDLTLLVKAMYSLSNSKYNDFLKRQIDAIIETNTIDIRQMYIDYYLSDCSMEEIEAELNKYNHLF